MSYQRLILSRMHSTMCIILPIWQLIYLRHAYATLSNLAHHSPSHILLLQAGFNRASSARLCATTDDHTNDLKWSSPFQVQRVSPYARLRQEMPASMPARKLRNCRYTQVLFTISSTRKPRFLWNATSSIPQALALLVDN